LEKNPILEFYRPNAESDKALYAQMKEIFCLAYGQTTSDVIEKYHINIMNTIMNELPRYTDERSTIVLARDPENKDRILGWCIAQGCQTNEMDPVRNLPIRKFHSEIAEINYLSVRPFQPQVSIGVLLVWKATEWLHTRGFCKIQIQATLGWDSDAYQMCGFRFMGDHINEDCVYSYFFKPLELTETTSPLESMASSGVFISYNRAPIWHLTQMLESKSQAQAGQVAASATQTSI